MSEETVNVTEQRKYIFMVSCVVKKKDILSLLSVCHMSLFYLLYNFDNDCK